MGTYTNSWDPNNGAILRSSDRGATWAATPLPFKLGGNMPGPGMGEQGIEETAVLDLVSPPAGAPLLSALGDIGGFRHDALDQVPALMFQTPFFGTTTSIDFAESQPQPSRPPPCGVSPASTLTAASLRVR